MVQLNNFSIILYLIVLFWLLYIFFFFRQPPRGKNAHARTAVNTARTVWDSPVLMWSLPTKRPPKLANRQSFTLESQKKIRLQNQLRKSKLAQQKTKPAVRKRKEERKKRRKRKANLLSSKVLTRQHQG